MKLQLALDLLDIKKALNICKKTSKYIDIIELGTPLIKQHGLPIIKKFKKFKKPIVADLKTMDTGFFEAQIAYKQGANISTVLAASDIPTIKGAIQASKKYKKKILVDLINIKNITKKAKEIKKLNPNYFCIHTGIDSQNQGKTPFKDLKLLSKIINKNKIAIAGGINLENIDKIIKFNPEIIIVGGAITKAKKPKIIAKKLKEKIK